MLDDNILEAIEFRVQLVNDLARESKFLAQAFDLIVGQAITSRRWLWLIELFTRTLFHAFLFLFLLNFNV